MWADCRTGNYNFHIYFSKSTDGGETWGKDVLVCSGIDYSLNPDFVIDSSNILYAVWSADVSANASYVYFSKSTDSGTTWATPVRIDDGGSENYAAKPKIAIDKAGTLYVVWYDKRDGNYNIYFTKSTNGGDYWRPNIRVNSTTANRQCRSVISIWEDILYVMWDGDQTGNWDVYFSSSIDGGTNWSNEVRVNDITVNEQWLPSLTVGKEGTIYGVWYDYRKEGDTCDIYFSKSTNSGLSWESSRKVTDQCFCIAPPSADKVCIAVDTLGNIHCTWGDYRGGSCDIYFSYSIDDGLTWAPNVMVNDNTFAAQRYPDMCMDRDNNLCLVWSDARNGNDFDLYCCKGTLSTGIENIKTYDNLAVFLYQNYPNPFSTTTAIKLSGYQAIKSNNPIARLLDSSVALEIYDLSGRLIRTFRVNPCSNLCQSVSWDGYDDDGKMVPNGIYLYMVRADTWGCPYTNFTLSKKMTILK